MENNIVYCTPRAVDSVQEWQSTKATPAMTVRKDVRVLLKMVAIKIRRFAKRWDSNVPQKCQDCNCFWFQTAELWTLWWHGACSEQHLLWQGWGLFMGCGKSLLLKSRCLQKGAWGHLEAKHKRDHYHFFTQQSCGLCGNQTAALSNTCYDKNKECPEVVKQRGGCHRNGEVCRKVRLQLKVPCIHLTKYKIQSCGLCEGMTKHESNSDCYDNVDNCQELTFNCHKYGKHCKKVSHYPSEG